MISAKFHDYRACTIDDCELCQGFVDTGQVMACDDCGEPGDKEGVGAKYDRVRVENMVLRVEIENARLKKELQEKQGFK